MKYLLSIIVLLFTAVTFAQTPQGFNYQATVRNSAGDLIANQNVYFKFNVLQGSQTSVPLYSETHFVPTDDLGQVNLVIGQGTPDTGSFTQIDWSLGSYFLGIELDTGNGYIAMGTTQMLSVPYALYAENAGNTGSTNLNLEQVLAQNNSANNQQIKDLQDPTDAQDAVTKNYTYSKAEVDAIVADLQSQIDDIDSPTNPDPDNEVISGNITDNTTWTNDKIWELDGKVYVIEGVTLTIEPGTIIKGQPSTGSSASALIIAQDATLIADGSASEPIIFTSSLDSIEVGQTSGTNLDVNDRGLWGGLLVFGNAPSSFRGDFESALYDGLSPTEPGNYYGGSNFSDSSGILRYISIRHGGADIGESIIINGLTLGGVGNGTLVDHIEVVANLDDGIEFFGGTVNASNLLVWGVGDDAIDIDQAYSGTITNVITIQENISSYGLEIDGPEGSYQAAFTINNLTMYGDDSATVDGVSGNREYADFRDNAQGSVNNVYTEGFLSSADVELDDQATSDNYTASELVFSNWEMVLPSGINDVTEIWKDTAAMPSSFTTDASNWASSVTEGNQTTGADASVFSWTYSHHNGALGL